MNFKFLIYILAIQFPIFFTGFVYNNKVKEFKPRLAKFFKALYLLDSFIVIVYVMFFVIYIFKQNSTYFTYCNIKFNYYILSAIILITNIVKLVYFLVIKSKREREQKNDYNNSMFFALYLLMCLIILPSILTIFKETVSYIPEENIQLIEVTSFEKIELVEKELGNINDKQYELLFINKDNNVIDLDKVDIEVFYALKRYIEKYEIKEVIEDCFGTKKINTIYEYKIYTPDKTEKNLILMLND